MNLAKRRFFLFLSMLGAVAACSNILNDAPADSVIALLMGATYCFITWLTYPED